MAAAENCTNDCTADRQEKGGRAGRWGEPAEAIAPHSGNIAVVHEKCPADYTEPEQYVADHQHVQEVAGNRWE